MPRVHMFGRWRVLAACVALAGCAGGSIDVPAMPTPTPIPTPTPTPTEPAGVAEMAVVPVRVTYVLRTLIPSLDSLFPASDSLSAARCAAIGLVCHQYVYRREPLRLRAEGAQLVIDSRMSYRARLGTIGGSARVASCGYAPEAMRRARRPPRRPQAPRCKRLSRRPRACQRVR